MFMNKMNLTNFSAALLVVAGMMSSCKKDASAPATITDADVTAARATYGTRTVNFDNRTDGTTYTSSQAAADFGNIAGGWDDTNAYISGGGCRIKLLANEISSDGGMLARVLLPSDNGYEVTFSVKYHSAFPWGRGGKVGFGFQLGDTNGSSAGCGDIGTTRGSARLMWYTDNSGRTYFRPYAYYTDMPDNCGDDFDRTYPTSGSLSKGSWYTVKIRVKANTGTNSNGELTYIVNGTTVYSDTSFRWTTGNSTDNILDELYFHTYRGGSNSDWATSAEGLIYFDNVSWKPI
jgi:hypothetical protein